MKAIFILISFFILLLLLVAMSAAIAYIVCNVLITFDKGGSYPEHIQELILDSAGSYFVLFGTSIIIWLIFGAGVSATM